MQVVFDTNTVVSALLFAGGNLAWLRPVWQEGRIIPLVSRPTVEELCHVLSYPKFHLTRDEQEALLGDYLPRAQVVDVNDLPADIPRCRDPDGQMFLDLAIAGQADYLVSGDRDLLSLEGQSMVKTIDPATFRQLCESTILGAENIHECTAPQY